MIPPGALGLRRRDPRRARRRRPPARARRRAAAPVSQGVLGWTEATGAPLDRHRPRPPDRAARQRARAAAARGHRRAHAQGVKVAALVGRVAAGRARRAAGRRHHHRPGLRGGRAHRRGGEHGARARRRRRHRPGAGARRRRHRHRPADGGRHGARRAGRVDRFDLAHRRRVRHVGDHPAEVARGDIAPTPCGRGRYTGKPARQLRTAWTEAWESRPVARARFRCRCSSS